MATTSTASLRHYSNHNLPLPYVHLQPKTCQHHHFHTFSTTPLSSSFSPRRRRPSRRLPKKRNDLSQSQSPSSDPNRIHFVLDVDQLKTKTPLSVQRAVEDCGSYFHGFVSSGIEAYNDLRNIIIIEPGSNRIVVSCSESTVRFVGGFILWSFVGVVLIRVLVNLGLGFKKRSENVRVEVVKRRDRSLGGREVVIERRVVDGGERKSDLGINEPRGLQVFPRNSRRKYVKKLPNWWMAIGTRPIMDEANREDFRREANKLVQGLSFEELKFLSC